MAVNSINTNIAAYYAQSNIGVASTSVSLSVSRLSSGNRIVRASDDVAALSIGTSLRTTVSTLRTAKVNTAQGSSLLQVADGALGQATEILQRQKAIAVQAGSGSLTATERAFLNQEFQALTLEIDRLVGQTNFNGVKLLNGQLSERVALNNVATQATAASATITFAQNPGATETVIINGVTLTAVASGATGLQFNIGASIAETVQNIAEKLAGAETDSAFSAAQKLLVGDALYTAQGNSLVIKSRAGGELGGIFRIDLAGTATATLGEAGVSAAYGGSYYSAFATGFTSSTASLAAAAAGAATPFQTGDVLTAVVGTNTFSLYTIADGDSLRDIVNGINANASTTGIKAELVLQSNLGYNIRLSYDNPYQDITFSGGANYNATLGGAINGSGTTTNQLVYGLGGGVDNGVGLATTSVTGSVGNNILTGLVATKSKVTITFPEIADSDLLDTTNFGNTSGVRINVGGQDFVFTTEAVENKAANEIKIGATLAETLDNAVATINAYQGVGAERFELDQISVRRDGLQLIFESRDTENVIDLSNGTSTVSITNLSTASTSNSGNLSNSDTGGVITSGINNAAFLGKISGFTATYVDADEVDLSIKIGNYTYTAQSVDTTATANTKVRLYSDTLADGSTGGYFEIELRENQGEAVSNQVGANAFTDRLNAAFGSLTFYQNRNVASYSGTEAIVTNGSVTGSLIGTKVTAQLGSFDDIKIDSISVVAPQGSSTNGSLSFVVNGVAFNAPNNLGSVLGANQTYRLTSATNANEFIEFTTGSSTIDFSTADSAAAFTAALKKAFGVGDGSAALAFQVGATSADTLRVGISDISTNALFKGKTLDVLTQESASLASDTVDAAIKIVTAVRADVGALQSRFNFAAANIESSIQNQDAARGELLDTDIASESTSFATSQVKLQAGISTLAQANQQLQNLLKLIG